MHFVTKMEQDPIDVRSRTVWYFKCGGCGHVEGIFYYKGLTTTMQVKCPKCKLEDDTQELNFLLDKKSTLEKNISSMQAELDKVNTKINVLQTIKSLPTRSSDETLHSTGAGSVGHDLESKDLG